MVNKNKEMSSAMTSNNATIPFVSNANGQDAIDKENIDMSKRSATQPPRNYKSDSDCLRTVTLKEVMQTEYKSNPPVIDNFLVPGVCVFAGAPKIGKSLLMAQIAFNVSIGQTFLGKYAVHKCAVLYFDLENSLRRVKERIKRMFGSEGPENVYMVDPESFSPKNLEGQIERFLNDHLDCRLVIIDTLQKIRQNRGGYANDYKTIEPFKKLADRYQICIVLVHHTRKQDSKNLDDRISGSYGLSGSADTTFVMGEVEDKTNEAVVYVKGRDQPYQSLFLKRDPDTLVWNLETDQPKEEPDETLEAVSKLVSAECVEWTGSPTDLCDAIGTDLKSNKLTAHLNANANKLRSKYGVEYQNHHGHSGRVITLTYIPKPEPIPCDNQDAISSTVAADGSSVDMVDVAMCENGRDDYSGCNDQDTSSIVVVADGSIVDMADVVRVYERDGRYGSDDENTISSTVAADGSGVSEADKAVRVYERDGCDDENTISSTVAADGSSVDMVDKAVCENGRDDDDQSASFKM